MLKQIQSFFDKHLSSTEESPKAHDYALATAALWIEMVRMDGVFDDDERRMLEQLLTSQFELNAEELEALMTLAEEESKDATDYFQFTKVINTHFEYEDKVKLVEGLWRIAYADGNVDPHEEHLVRKLSELLYVSHPDFIAAKHRVIR